MEVFCSTGRGWKGIHIMLQGMLHCHLRVYIGMLYCDDFVIDCVTQFQMFNLVT